MNNKNTLKVRGDVILTQEVTLHILADHYFTKQEELDYSKMKQSEFKEFASSKGWIVVG